jgi:hypothetical protein
MVSITLKTTLTTIQNKQPGPTRRNGIPFVRLLNASSKALSVSKEPYDPAPKEGCNPYRDQPEQEQCHYRNQERRGPIQLILSSFFLRGPKGEPGHGSPGP